MKLKGLKKACGEMNRNKHLNRTIMYDQRDGDLWVDAFPDQNSWNEYHSSKIIPVLTKREGMWNNYEHTSMYEIKQAIKEAVVEQEWYDEIYS